MGVLDDTEKSGEEEDHDIWPAEGENEAPTAGEEDNDPARIVRA